MEYYIWITEAKMFARVSKVEAARLLDAAKDKGCAITEKVTKSRFSDVRFTHYTFQ